MHRSGRSATIEEVISLVLAALLATQGPDSHLVLSRGAVVRGTRIWDVEDATLDANKPTENSEGDVDLAGGPFKTILIRFGDLDRVIRPNQRVVRASLVFTTSGGDPPKLQSISRMLVPWGQGPYRTLGGFMRPHPIPGADPTPAAAPAAPLGSATWRDSRAGLRGGTWETPGARGNRDAAPISAIQFAADANGAHIDGLAAAVQEMADHPDENNGLAIVLDNAASFASSESDSGRPALVLDVEEGPSKSGPDLSVVAIDRTNANQKLPADGEAATYTAHVKNVGDAPAKGFSATWILDDRPGTTAPSDKVLVPGEETTFTYRLAYHPDKTDHRFQTVGFRIKPAGEDANPRNDSLTVAACGQPVTVVIRQDVAKEIANGVNARGSHAVEDWAQAQVRALNDVYLAQSRFSFAPEGVKERVTIQQILVGDPAISGSPEDPSRIPVVAAPGDLLTVDQPFLRALGESMGLTNRALSNVSEANNAILPCGGSDRFPGLMNYGDTRFEGLAPGQIELPYEAYSAPVFDNPPLEPTGLLAATDVLQLNAALGGPAPTLPGTIQIQARNMTNVPLAGLSLEIFPAVGGRIAKEAQPAFKVTTDPTGNAILPNKGGSAFGAANPAPGSDAFFIRASLNGVTAGCWLKAWQVIDTAARGGVASRAVSIMYLNFDLPAAELDTSTNMAADRIVTDSAGSLPAKLAALIDGSTETDVAIGGKANDWVEMDLGRDRTIGEIDLILKPGAFWNKFDVFAYGTGQRPEEGVLWAKEVDGAWTSTNRAVPAGSNRVSVAYRGPVVRVRYLRFVSRVDAPGTLAEIRVVPVKNP
jgi:hypothetical protein